MAVIGSSTAIMSAREPVSSSQMLSSSMSSLSHSASSRHASSHISKVYRQASTLFLTRRLPESLSTILPVITSSSSEYGADGNGTTASLEPAPIATASRTTRIKVWSLYLTILNAVVELDPEEGKQAFGTQEWRALVSKVREGQVWEEVVMHGYGGVEGDVDSDVVINLATLLLAHARTQALNQQRLENYLAMSSQPNLDLSSRLQEDSEGRPLTQNSSPGKRKVNGTDTPRDLNARVKILELYTLHVLLRNNEWDYAREFIGISEVLDDERREAFLQALQSLQDEQVQQKNREMAEQRRQEEQLQKDLDEAKRRRLESEERERVREEERLRESQRFNESKRASSEVDYGIESSHPAGSANGSVKGKSTKGVAKQNRNGASASFSHTSRPSNSGKRVVAAPSMMSRAGIIIGNVKKLLETMAVSMKTNPMVLLRTLAFVVALLVALSRNDVKERLKRLVGNGWNKVRATAGMGVKVSYV